MEREQTEVSCKRRSSFTYKHVQHTYDCETHADFCECVHLETDNIVDSTGEARIEAVFIHRHGLDYE